MVILLVAHHGQPVIDALPVLAVIGSDVRGVVDGVHQDTFTTEDRF